MSNSLFYEGGDNMKKLIATVALGTLLVAGFFTVNNAPTDLSMDREPSIYSIGNSTF